MLVSAKGLLFSILLFSFGSSSSQQLTQSHFDLHEVAEVTVDDYSDNIGNILKLDGVYLDHGSTHSTLKLYITAQGYHQLEQNDIKYKWRPIEVFSPNMKTVDDLKDYFHKSDCLEPMDFYPTYEAYEQMMFDFESKYPDICEIIEIGILSSGRKILAAHIGDQLGVNEEEPNFLYTSTMHGDELAGFPIMLMYIDMLLCNYGTDERITELVNNINIYINPLANPDGTYRGGNATVAQSIRFNNQFADLNRNYPDFQDGPNPDGRETQEEALLFIDFAEQFEIHLSCNIHSGVEVCNYPHDTFVDRPSDESWWERVMREYATTAQDNSPNGYMTFLDNGVTNGFDWFEANGGRQDFVTFFHRTREFTLEISNDKRLNAALLPTFWDYNRDALLNYMEEAQYGLRGTITDCNTGIPVLAEIIIPEHDSLNSSVFSSISDGSYFRFLDEGQYDIIYVAEGYDTLRTQVDIIDKTMVRFDASICPMLSTSTEDSPLVGFNLYHRDNKIFIDNGNEIIKGRAVIYNIDGQKVHESDINDMSINLSENLSFGIYIVNIETNDTFSSHKVLIHN